MSGKKLSSDEVPQKFIEWLLAMECPTENIPSIEKMIGMCRGQYYMVWRSLMEHVEEKDVISYKRLTVFDDDVKLCQEKKLLNERGSSPLLPEQLSLWKEHTEVKEMVAEAEERVLKARTVLNELMDKVSRKVIQRKSSRQRIADLQRRSWLLSQVFSELTTRIANLKETRAIADTLCDVEKEQNDIQNKFDKCIALLRQQKSKSSTLSLSTPLASSSLVSNHENETTSNETDDYVKSFVNCRGDVLWPRLIEKQNTLYSRLTEAYTKQVDVTNNRTYKRSILGYTEALQSTLALEAIKNRAHFQRTQQKLTVSIEDLSSYVTEDAFELLILKVQRAYTAARVKSLKALLEDLTARRGVFDCGDDRSRAAVDAQATLGSIASVNKSIVKTREELERLIWLSLSTERKIYNIRECLLAVFIALYNSTDISYNALATGVQLDFPTESIPLLCQFYKKRRERAANVGNLSFNFDMSDQSFGDVPDNPTFVDELNVYLKKFNLENNRKLVLDNGEEIWIFETVQALSSRLLKRWVADDVTILLHPSVRVSRALRLLHDDTRLPRPAPRPSDDSLRYTIPDLTAIKNHEEDTVDKMKKTITENLNLLKKVHKKLDACEENLDFWSKHQLKTYISTKRMVDGKTYKEYEELYIEKLNYW
ncbi:uncharacterized protein LOC123865535 [Maniola jurtina]|uniref:uncharacterized protein LOC123865535 n=1 Tax=Maniola jurtina TaxID=191418 RepID=UPI001E68DC91|nr:uncharacterized protein LOC123865535 [Maniola jurtina]XP_045762578.1 uncharacterized protein LOC123865535 [Maniola jurtina]